MRKSGGSGARGREYGGHEGNEGNGGKDQNDGNGDNGAPASEGMSREGVGRTISRAAGRLLQVQQAGLVLISSELPEVLNLSTRVLVLRHGRVVAELPRAQADQERVMRLMAGLERGAA